MITGFKLRAAVFAVAVGLLPLLAGTQAGNQPTDKSTSILGFTPAGAAKERHVEEEFLQIPSTERAREWHRYLTAEPHPAASERNNELADYIAEQWRQQGWE